MQQQNNITEDILARYRSQRHSSKRESVSPILTPVQKRRQFFKQNSLMRSQNSQENIIDRTSNLSSIRGSRVNSVRVSEIMSADPIACIESNYQNNVATIPEDLATEDEEPAGPQPTTLKSYRNSDPFLPEERDLVESILNKHKDHSIIHDFEQGVTFSSGVKIRSTSPPDSSQTSYELEASSSPRVLPKQVTVSFDTESISSSEEQYQIHKKSRDVLNKKSPKLTQRKISITVKSVVRNNKPTDEPIKSGNGSDDDDGSSDSCSSDYESDVLKTEEGFIIPEYTISKVNGIRRDSCQIAIEKQFKKDNFLKDRPVRRGIRMPVGSTGKVRQLRSIFERHPSRTALDNS